MQIRQDTANINADAHVKKQTATMRAAILSDQKHPNQRV